MKRTVAAALAALACVHCSSPEGATEAATGATGGGGGGSVDPCSAEALAQPAAATTYFVAVDEPGADNDACDGLAPSDEGNGRCPFKDFSAAHVRALLMDAKGVRVEVRAGTYTIQGWEGLVVSGAGASETEPVVLTSHAGETAVLDVPAPDGAGCMTDPMQNPDCVRQIVNVTGSHTVVQGLTIQNGLGYNMQVVGGSDHLVRCNLFRETVDFAMRSDSLKLADTANTVVQDNEFTSWRSQAIDTTGSRGITIERNEFHDPFDADGGAVGCKLGTADVTIRDNAVHDLGDSTTTHVFALGGTGTPTQDEFLAHGIHVVSNRVWNVVGILAQLTSCDGCSIEDNEGWNLGAGILLSAAALGSAECATSPAGCLPSAGTRISGNRMREMVGSGGESANIFVVVEPGEGDGLTAGENLYCAPAAADARFGWDGQLLDLAGWVAASGTDSTSEALATGDARCSAW